MKKDKAIIVSTIISFLILLGLSIIPDKNISFIKSFNGISPLYIFFLIVLIPFVQKTNLINDKKIKTFAIILAIIISLIDLVGYSLNNYENLSNLYATFPTIIKNLIRFTGVFLLSFNALKFILDKVINNIFDKHFKFKINRKTYFILWGIFLLLLVPYFLMFYPGILSVDSISQVSQALGKSPLVNHHPIFHTFIISIFINVGKAINNINFGVALYTMFQMIVMSGIFSYTIYYFLKNNINKYLIIFLTIFYSLFPVIGVYSVTMWKDIMFSGFFLLLIIKIYEMIKDSQAFFSKKTNYILLIILTSMVYLLRNNGYYVLLLSFLIFLVFLKNYRLYMIGIVIFLLGFNFIYTGPIFKALNVKSGPTGEMLSIPLQQLARVQKNHYQNLNDQEKNDIDKYFNLSKNKNIGDYYYSRKSDAVKKQLNEKYFQDNKSEFLKIWFKNFSKYPVEYIESFLMNNYGYWYSEVEYWITKENIRENDLGIIEESKLPIMKKIFISFELSSLRTVPIISLQYSTGIWILINMFLMVICLIKKEYKKILVFVPILMLWLTCLASPVHAEYRYMFGIVLATPFLVGTLLLKNGKK